MVSTPTTPDAEVAVVGLGAWGACALWQLARHGVDAVGVDRYGIANVHGSSYGESRMFRTACLEHPGLVPLAQRSRRLWTELEALSGESLLEPTGAMLIGPRDGRIVGGALTAAREHGLSVELLDPAALRTRAPAHAALPDDHVAVLEPDGGLTYPERTISAAVRAARAAGARVYTDTRVTGVELVAGGAVVHTALRSLRVARVVVTAGPWLSQLVPDLPLEVVRMPTTWFTPAEPRPRFTLENLPVFMRELDGGDVIWGHGTLPGRTELKLGLEDGGRHFRTVDPEDMDRSVSPDDWSVLGGILPTAVPGVGAAPTRAVANLYARTPDGQFVVGRPRRDPRIVVAGGCSSHGFKHATGIGEFVADLVRGRTPAVPLDFADPNRFL
ncbi:N-methyl-L-tryptophan oxidase [Streptomyces durbertensis]|uniref:N-methyl-L-tryptophan oxidase n=1 Tax=Streptomyces durbertensis TaxID=2448886 RepID=A0ABR6EE61_9ACTN|nr:N-methyl-L-tryptophan oxidase [Streptomyces durbertensis]MBB1243610.1 N-methyl-L-tryptophan oxidase [Streptomyces durbertensis]